MHIIVLADEACVYLGLGKRATTIYCLSLSKLCLRSTCKGELLEYVTSVTPSHKHFFYCRCSPQSAIMLNVYFACQSAGTIFGSKIYQKLIKNKHRFIFPDKSESVTVLFVRLDV